MTVVLAADGGLVTGRLLAWLPWTRWLTWVFQVMPIFFVVGGAVNAGSWRRAAASGEPWSVWIARRARRLLVPLAPLVALWLVLPFVMVAAGLPGEVAARASHAALLPIWFLGVYVGVVAATPLALALHDRFGPRLLVVLALVALGIDLAARAGPPALRLANVAIVWVGVHQLGFAWRDELAGVGARRGLAAALAGGAALIVAVQVGGYPVSMVDVGGGIESNASPPTVVLLGLAGVQLALVLAARAPLARLAADARARALSARLGSVALTIYLWHMTAMVLVLGAALAVPGGALAPAIGPRWWAERPLWIAAFAVALVPLVRLAAPFESASRIQRRVAPRFVPLGLALALAAIAWIVRRGVYDVADPVSTPLVGVGLLFSGLLALGALGRRASSVSRAGDGR